MSLHLSLYPDVTISRLECFSLKTSLYHAPVIHVNGQDCRINLVEVNASARTTSSLNEGPQAYDFIDTKGEKACN